MINLDRYLIPKEVIIGSDIQALESYLDECESYLCMVAMESSGQSNDKFTSMSSRARAAGKKMIEGQKTNNATLVSQGNRELTNVTNELVAENKKAKDSSLKTKIVMVAKVIIGVIGSVLLAFGVYKAGKAVVNFFGNRGGKSTPPRPTQSHTIQSDPAVANLQDAKEKAEKLQDELKNVTNDSSAGSVAANHHTATRQQMQDFDTATNDVLRESSEDLKRKIKERHAAASDYIRDAVNTINSNEESSNCRQKDTANRLSDMQRTLDEMDNNNQKSRVYATFTNGKETREAHSPEEVSAFMRDKNWTLKIG